MCRLEIPESVGHRRPFFCARSALLAIGTDINITCDVLVTIHLSEIIECLVRNFGDTQLVISRVRRS